MSEAPNKINEPLYVSADGERHSDDRRWVRELDQNMASPKFIPCEENIRAYLAAKVRLGSGAN